MVKKGTFLQGILQKLPSKRAGIHGWQRRFMILKDKELRYYERMVRSTITDGVLNVHVRYARCKTHVGRNTCE